MRIAFLTDLHLRDDRLDEQADALASLPNEIDMVGVDLILVGGDLAGVEVPHRATPRERNALITLIRGLAETAPVVIVRGNHDSPGDYDFFNFIEGKNFIGYFDQCEHLQLGDMSILCLPWLDRSAFPRGTDHAEGVTLRYTEAIAAVKLNKANAIAYKLGLSVVLCHGAAVGATLVAGQPPVPTADPVVSLDTLLPEKTFNVALLGHYHHAQKVKSKHCSAWYGGSLFCSDYGEDVTGHGWTLYDIAAGGEGVPVSRTRYAVAQVPRVVYEMDASLRKLEDVRPSKSTTQDFVTSPAGVHVKLVAKVREGDGPALAHVEAQRAAMLANGALSVRVELRTERTPRLRAGAEAVAKAKLLKEKVELFLPSLITVGLPGKTVKEMASDVMSKLYEIETELDSEAA